MSTGDFVLSGLGLLFLAFFGEGIAAFLGYVVFTVCTFGFVRVQGAQERKMPSPWHGFTRNSDGKIIVEQQMAILIGMVVLILGGLLFFAWRTGAI